MASLDSLESTVDLSSLESTVDLSLLESTVDLPLFESTVDLPSLESTVNSDLPSLDEMRAVVKDRFGFFPCTWQLKAALTQLERNDLLTLAPTGSGKTLTFWIPLLFNGGGVSIVVTPLNVLGEKNVSELSLVSIPAVNLTASSASDKTFKVLH